MGKVLSIGVVGCGRISQFHLEALRELPTQFLIAAVADTSETRAKTFGEKYHCRWYNSQDEMMAKEKLDLIVLCTPSGLHPEQALKCAVANQPCLSEKPFGCSYSESLKVVEDFERRRVPLYVVFQNRFNPTIQKVRRWHDQGVFGKIYFIQANVFWQRPQSYYDAESWRGSRKLDGGVFLNQASHYCDMVQWFGGDVQSVSGAIATLGRRIESEDTGTCSIQFKSGAIGSIAATTLTYPENIEGSLTILAENATIRVGGKALNRLEVCKIKSEPNLDLHKEVSYEPENVYGNGHLEYYKHFYQVYQDPKGSDLITGREALKSLKLINDLYQFNGATS